MYRHEIVDAYIFLQKNQSVISKEMLEFIKDASLSVYDSLQDDYCRKCVHDGFQECYPSACTGCGGEGEKHNFKLAC